MSGRSDPGRWGGEALPDLSDLFPDGLGDIEDPVGEVSVLVKPEHCFHGVEFRAAGRQPQDCDVVRTLGSTGYARIFLVMPACVVE